MVFDVMKIQQPHHTVLFNIAAYTVMKLSVAEGKRIYSYIEEIMNGDGLYEGASKETILEAYHNQSNPCNTWTWVDLIAECRAEMDDGTIEASDLVC